MELFLANKLSQEHAAILIDRANKECSITGNRFGCTIWKYLTLKQISNIIAPEKDIFYVKDNGEALKLFNLYCVEPVDTVIE